MLRLARLANIRKIKRINHTNENLSLRERWVTNPVATFEEEYLAAQNANEGDFSIMIPKDATNPDDELIVNNIMSQLMYNLSGIGIMFLLPEGRIFISLDHQPAINRLIRDKIKEDKDKSFKKEFDEKAIPHIKLYHKGLATLN